MESYTIDIGDEYWRIINGNGKNETGLCYANEGRAKDEKDRLKLNDCTVEHVDTLLTVGQVFEQIEEHEGHVWSEYLSISHGGLSSAAKWPQGYNRLMVFVVTGGSEGMYLHIDFIIKGTVTNCILGKTLETGKHTDELWLSAGRIAAALGA
jgi:hypothetical protein